MSTALQIEKNFIDAGKTLMAGVVAQIVGPYDNTELARPRLEVGFGSLEQLDRRQVQNSNAVYYQSDYEAAWSFAVVTAHTDANHSTYVGQVREKIVAGDAMIVSNTNTYYEVSMVRESGAAAIERDAENDELRTELVFATSFAVKPW